MNRKIVLISAAASLLTGLSCASDVVSVEVQYAMFGSPDENCSVTSASDQKGGGSIDVGWTGAYYLGLQLVNHLEATDITAAGAPVNPASRNDFFINQVALSYTGKGISIPDQVVNTAGTVLAGGKLAMGVNALTYDAAERLKVATLPPGGLEVLVGMKFRGAFASGSSYETASFKFPIRVYSSGTTQAACFGTKESLSGNVPACGNWGQDGEYFKCKCADTTSTDACGGCATGQTCNTTTCGCE
jgi:hypothetical protein